MKCIHCKGTMERKTAPFQVDRNDYHLTLENVPAWVCSQCGEVYFDEREVDEIQEVIRSVDQQTEKMATSA